MKTKIAILVALLVLLAGGYFAFSKLSNVFYPKMTLSILQINQIGSEEANLDVEVSLKNRSPLAIDFESFSFYVSAENKELVKTDTAIPLSLKSFRTTRFKLPVKLNVHNIKSLSEESTKDSLEYHFGMCLTNKKNFLLPDTISINSSETLPVYYLPKVMLTKIEPIKILKKGGPTFYLHLQIRNNNASPLEVKQPKYSATFEGTDVLLAGQYPKDLYIKAKSTKYLKIPVQMEKKTILEHAGKLLFNKDELDVNLIFEGNMVTRSEYIDGCHLRVIIKGNFKELTGS